MWSDARRLSTAAALVVLVAVVVCALLTAQSSRFFRVPFWRSEQCEAVVHLAGHVNPCIAVPFRVGAYESLFVLDTGYAGAPVLNARMLHLSSNTDIEATLQRLAGAPGSASHAQAALTRFVHANQCAEYTSGCVLRLMGIGITAERASDMLLCPPLELRSADGGYFSVKRVLGVPQADVLVTNHEMSSPHILTLDYLIHLAPCLLAPARGVLRLAMPGSEYLYHRATAQLLADEVDGGAFMCRVAVGGVVLRCTVDTGAAATVCVAAAVADSLALRPLAPPRHMRQVGINGELVCSELRLGTVTLAGHTFADVPIFVNDGDSGGTDGYVGLGMLRAFELLVSPQALHARRSSLPPQSLEAFEHVLHAGACAG